MWCYESSSRISESSDHTNSMVELADKQFHEFLMISIRCQEAFKLHWFPQHLWGYRPFQSNVRNVGKEGRIKPKRGGGGGSPPFLRQNLFDMARQKPQICFDLKKHPTSFFLARTLSTSLILCENGGDILFLGGTSHPRMNLYHLYLIVIWCSPALFFSGCFCFSMSLSKINYLYSPVTSWCVVTMAYLSQTKSTHTH